MSGPPTTERTRLGRAARRDQLLDCAAELLVDGGLGAVTMEGVAAQAGVSKALPYAHFDNATDLVRGLRDRELLRLGNRILRATAAVEGLEPAARAAAHAYFETIRERGAELVAALRSLPMDDEETARREDPAFFAPLLQRHLGLSPDIAHTVSAIFVAGVNGAVDAWVTGRLSQAEAEDLYVRLLLGGAAAVARDSPSS